MRRNLLLLIVGLLLLPVGMTAQTWESGTSKNGSVSKNVREVWYSVTLPEDGQVDFTFEPLGNTSSENITLYAVVDGENQQRAFAWVDGSNRTLTCPNMKPGTYKVKVAASPKNDKASGTFRLHYTFTAPFYKTDPTPNDTWDDCPLLEDGVTMHGHMGYAYSSADVDNIDWFRFEVPKDGKLTFELISTSTLKIGFGSLNVLNADGTEVNQRNGMWFDKSDESLIFEIPDVSAGTYYLRLPLYSGYGIYHLTPRFTPVVVDSDPELNDTWETATLLSESQPQNAHLGYFCNGSIYNDDVDWFQVVVPEDGKLTFEARSSSTLKLGFVTLNTLKPDGSDVVQRNGTWFDKSDASLIFEIPDVSAGTYYFRVPRYSGYGNYSLTYYFTSHAAEADPEPNNTWDTATELKAGPSVTGQLGYDYKDTKDVEDWYVLNVPEEGVISISVQTESTLRIGFGEIKSLNADGNDTDRREARWFDIPDSTLVLTLPNAAAGNYYLRLPHYSGYGTYRLRYNFTPCSKQNDVEPNNEFVEAGLIEQGVTNEARLGYDYNNSKDVRDWFKFEVPEEGAITISVHSEPTLKIGFGEIKVLSADGTDTDRREARWFDIADTTLVLTLPNAAAGTYYLFLPHYSGYGGYTVRYDFTPCSKQNDAEPNNEFVEAGKIESGSTNEARLGYDYNNSKDVRDWFKFDVPEEGVITIAVHSEPTLQIGFGEIKALNDDGTDTNRREARWFDTADTTLVLTLPNAAAGTYYLFLPHYSGYGGYTVKYDFTPCAYANDMAGNDSKENATPLTNGTTVQGRLGYDYNNSKDVKDWYQFTMEADGSASFTIQSEKTLKIGFCEILAPKADEDGTFRREAKWLDIPDTALVISAGNLAPGTYYLYIPHYSGYGGYSIKSNFSKNPYFRQKLTNNSFASRISLQQGKSVYGTLGYEYNTGVQNEAWFDLGTMHGTQIDVNVEVESSHSLTIGVATLYIYKGDNENGSPILQRVADQRLERSSGTISYVDKNTEDSHYIFCLPRYSGYGGYKVTLGDEKEEGVSDMASSDIRVMTGGRNTVRKGVPCENPITVSNLSDLPSDFFMLAVLPTENINIIGFRMPVGGGRTEYIPVDSVTVPGENMCLFVVPKLLPWESYTFTMISEGKGDIAYAPERVVFDANSRKVIILGTAVTVAAVGAFVKTAAVGLAVGAALDWVSKKAGDAIFPADSEAAQQYASLMGTTTEQLGIRSSWDSPGVYTAKSFVSTCTTEATKKIVPKTGTPLDIIGNTITVLQNIIPNLRRRIWYWIYKDLGYFDNNSLDVLDGKQAVTDVVASWDPNEMVGPQGVGEEHFISETQTMNYRILFENKAEAGDAAYRVRVSDELDENVFDLSSVRFGETSHDGVGYNWKMIREGNKLSWDIEGIELPPNVNAPEGEGYVSFSVDLKPNLPNGTKIKNKATIIFDKNYPIETNEFVNTLDLVPPTTTMSIAAVNGTVDAIDVKCTSVDAGSGVGSYLFFVSKNGEDYAYCGQSVTGAITYPVTLGNPVDTYSFYVLATDKVGNVERVIPEAIVADTGVDGIRIVNNPNASIKVYTVDGRYVGDTISGLKTGVYVVGGKKIFIK